MYNITGACTVKLGRHLEGLSREQLLHSLSCAKFWKYMLALCTDEKMQVWPRGSVKDNIYSRYQRGMQQSQSMKGKMLTRREIHCLSRCGKFSCLTWRRNWKVPVCCSISKGLCVTFITAPHSSSYRTETEVCLCFKEMLLFFWDHTPQSKSCRL
jgi:hypothetical protein